MKVLLEDEVLTLRELERALWALASEVVRQGLVEFLERKDKQLEEGRDRRRYELRGRERREVETLVGVVRFWRRRYVDREGGGSVYLLDERLGLAKRVRVSDGLAELSVFWAVKGPSYRDACNRLKELMGYQVISHETIRQAGLKLAERVRREDARVAAGAGGARKVKEIFIEADGVWASLQGRGRGPREAKVAVAYEGWRVRQGGGGRGDFTLVRPRYISGLDHGEGFWERVRGALSAEYRDIDETLVVLNGDDAGWIEAGAEHFGRCVYQRDRYHVARDLRCALAGRAEGREALAALRRGDTVGVVESVAAACRGVSDEATRDRLTRLGAGLAAAGGSIIDYRVRLAAVGHEVDPGWRGLGAVEATVKRYKHRIGKRGRAWSQRGLEAILTLQDKLYEGTLLEKVTGLSVELGSAPCEAHGLPPGKVPEAVGQGDPGRRGHVPALDAGMTGWAKVLRNLTRVECPW